MCFKWERLFAVSCQCGVQRLIKLRTTLTASTSGTEMMLIR